MTCREVFAIADFHEKLLFAALLPRLLPLTFRACLVRNVRRRIAAFRSCVYSAAH